jgi:hypothetical protein
MYRMQKLPCAFDWPEYAAVFTTTKGSSRTCVISTQAGPNEAASAFVTRPQTVLVHSEWAKLVVTGFTV